MNWALREMLSYLLQVCSSPEKGRLAQVSPYPEGVPVLETWQSVRPSSLAQGSGVVSAGVQVLDLCPRSQGLPLPHSLPSLAAHPYLSPAPSHQLQLKCSRESPDMVSGHWESDAVLSLTKRLTLDRVGHLMSLGFLTWKLGIGR